jgi:hypothetical protein
MLRNSGAAAVPVNAQTILLGAVSAAKNLVAREEL